MQQLLNETAALVEWYEKHARSAIEEFATDRVAGFDTQTVRLQRIAQLADAEVAACFLGQSGVGKSTLINALVGGSEVILPAGGVGPLTAQALEVRFSEKPMFTVQYHRMQQFWQLVFALEQKLLRQNEKADDSELKQELSGEDDELGFDDGQVVDHLERQGRLIINWQSECESGSWILSRLPSNCWRESHRSGTQCRSQRTQSGSSALGEFCSSPPEIFLTLSTRRWGMVTS